MIYREKKKRERKEKRKKKKGGYHTGKGLLSNKSKSCRFRPERQKRQNDNNFAKNIIETEESFYFLDIPKS